MSTEREQAIDRIMRRFVGRLVTRTVGHLIERELRLYGASAREVDAAMVRWGLVLHGYWESVEVPHRNESGRPVWYSGNFEKRYIPGVLD